MSSRSKFILEFSKMLAPTHVVMGRRITSSVIAPNYIQKANFSQILPGTNLKVSIRRYNKIPSTVLTDTHGNTLNKSNREHMHGVVETEKGPLSVAMYTTHPQTKTKTFQNAINLGKGTIENTNSNKDQFMVPKEVPLLLPEESFKEIQESDQFLSEVGRLSALANTISNEKLLEKPLKKIINVAYQEPPISVMPVSNKFNPYGNDKQGRPYRELMKEQIKEQVSTGKTKIDDIVNALEEKK